MREKRDGMEEREILLNMDCIYMRNRSTVTRINKAMETIQERMQECKTESYIAIYEYIKVKESAAI